MHEYGFTIEAAGSGGLLFYTPTGRLIPEVPELACVDAEKGHSALCDRHCVDGLDITDDTADSHWGGEDLDYNWVVEALLREAHFATRFGERMTQDR